MNTIGHRRTVECSYCTKSLTAQGRHTYRDIEQAFPFRFANRYFCTENCKRMYQQAYNEKRRKK